MMSCYSLGVLSDTHLTNIGEAMSLATSLIDGPFAGVDAILHAGDMLLPELESCFDDIPFYSVQGNMDESRAGLPFKRILEVGSFRIGLIHGWGKPGDVPRNVLSEFVGQNLDVLIFGHSHTPAIT